MTDLRKSPSFQAMKKFALAAEKEPIHEVRAALKWMTDFFYNFEAAQLREKARKQRALEAEREGAHE